MIDLRNNLLAFTRGEQADTLALYRAGLIDGKVIEWGGGKSIKVLDAYLTAHGRDFLALVQNETIWNTIAALVAERVGDTSAAIWFALLDREHRKALDLPVAEPKAEADADPVSRDL